MECPTTLKILKEVNTHENNGTVFNVFNHLSKKKEVKKAIKELKDSINCHEKLKDIIFEVARQAIAEYDINAPPLTKNRFANGFVAKLEQVLKEKP